MKNEFNTQQAISETHTPNDEYKNSHESSNRTKPKAEYRVP